MPSPRSRATHHGTDNHTEFAHIELSTSTGLKMQSDGISGVESPRAIHLPLPKPKPLSLLPLIALIFFDVSGGPFGIEVAVSSGGPFLAILGFLILPLAWSIPEALVTAELATAFPENSGYVAWVTAAFGPFWGFQEGFWKWLSGVTDNAVYPVMFLTYLQALVPILESGLPRLIFLVGLNLTLTYLNYRGLHVVGNMALGMTFFTLLPFVIMSLLGLPHVKPANWVAIEWSNVQWVPFLNVMFWSLNYWDSVSTLAGEVHSPKKTLPKALYIALVLVIGSYIVPLLIGIGISKNSSEWQLGFFATLAERVGGKWLAWWIVCAAAISQIGQFEAEMSSDSFQLQGMAERGFLPSIFNVRSVYGTPTMAIIFSSMGIMTMASFNFIDIVELLNVVYCIAEILEFVAFIWLRYKYCDLKRPYRIPLSNFGCIVMLTPAFILLLAMLLIPTFQGDMKVIGFTIIACAAGFTLYPVLQIARRRGWVNFEDLTPDEFKETLLQCQGSAGLNGSETETLLRQ